jgi:hypothetical protein
VAGVLKALGNGATPEQMIKSFTDANPNADPAKVAANIQQIMSTIPKEKLAALGIGENRTAFKGTPFEKEVPRGSAPDGSLQAQVDREGDALVGGAKKTAGYAGVTTAAHMTERLRSGGLNRNLYDLKGSKKVTSLANKEGLHAVKEVGAGTTKAQTTKLHTRLLQNMGVGQKDIDKVLKKRIGRDKAVRNLVRKRIRERAKKFTAGTVGKRLLNKVLSPQTIVRGIPVIGWVMLLYDAASIADAATSAPSEADIKEMTKGMSDAELKVFEDEYAKLQKDGEIPSKVGYFSKGGGWDNRFSFGPR